MLRLNLALLCILACGCSKRAAQGPAVADTAGLGPYVVVQASALHMEPSDAAFVPHPHDPQQTRPNVVALVARGQRGTVRAVRPGWAELALDTGAHGWVPRADLLAAATVSEATVLAVTPYYADATATAAAGILPAGAQLFVVARGEPRSQVHLPPRTLGYVATAQLDAEPRELGISRLMLKVPGLKPHKVAKILAEARAKYADAALLDTLVAQLDAVRAGSGDATRSGSVAAGADESLGAIRK